MDMRLYFLEYEAVKQKQQEMLQRATYEQLVNRALDSQSQLPQVLQTARLWAGRKLVELGSRMQGHLEQPEARQVECT